MPRRSLVTQTTSDVNATGGSGAAASLRKHPSLLWKIISSPLTPVGAGYAVACLTVIFAPPIIIMDFPKQNPQPSSVPGLVMIVGPLTGCLMALWYLLRGRRRAESLASLALGAPWLLLILGAASWLLRL